MDVQWKRSLQRRKMVNKFQTGQFDIVNDLLMRQDHALAELDLLDAKVDQTIKELIGNRLAHSNQPDPDCQTF